MPKKGLAPLWKELLAEISESWQKKKGKPYHFGGQDLKLLKALVSWLGVPEILALWTIYLRGGSYYGPRTGYLVAGMFQDRSILLDNPDFKPLTEKFDKKLSSPQMKFDDFLKGEK